MFRKFVRSLTMLVMLIGTVGGQSTADFQKSVFPVLSKRCFDCHNNVQKTSGLSLEIFRDPKLALENPKIWEKVRDQLSAGVMPPPPRESLSSADEAAVISWIDSLIGPVNAAAPIDPGRVTARRLNRAEYNNTIRDLLGVDSNPAGHFPVDNAGYGFDNIGDVLSISPLLMEKYVSAARSVAKAAIYGEPYEKKPGLVAKLMGKSTQDDGQASGDVLPYSMRGALYATYHFPVEADYELRFRYANRRQPPRPATAAGRGRGGRGPLTDEQKAAAYEALRTAVPPAALGVFIDGKQVLAKIVEGVEEYNYDRGPTIVRVHLTAGKHQIRASFPEHADLEKPRSNIHQDGRRILMVDYVDIFGPLNPSTAPPPSYAKVFTCGHGPGKHTAQCTRPVIESLARRAYRRPPTAAEVQQLLKLVTLVRSQGDSLEEGVKIALQAILTSPKFLFRVENEPKPGETIYKLNDHELATRLSYFLWSSMPDDELSRIADQRRLREPGVLEAQVKRMLKDPKSDNLVDNFAAQWLDLRALDRKKPDPEKFPMVDDELLDAMRRETLLFLGAIKNEDRSILDVIDGKFTYVNGPLARYYGIPGVKGEAFQRVELDGKQRGGVLTQGSILTLSSYANRTSPVIRGKWVLENLLGAAPPPPPPDIPALVETNVGTTVSLRERLEQHRANAACAACHKHMDPIGFGLENFDAAGAWRTKDGNFDIDNVGVLPDGKTFQGVAGLKQILMAQSPAFVRNATEKMLTYALGRGMETTDRATVARITRGVEAGNYKFSSMVMEVVKSDPFQLRKGQGATK